MNLSSHSERVRVGILGASGYGGGELLRRALRHPHIEVAALASRRYEGRCVGDCWPQLSGLFPGLRFGTAEDTLEKAELLFSAAPHGAAIEHIGAALEQGKRVIDLAADFRLPPEDYELWYGGPHPRPELWQRAVFGLVELHREEIRDADLLANPGCHSTTAILALAPLAAEGMLGDDVLVHATTGVSGAGRGAAPGSHFSEVNESYKPYSIAGTHRHTAEIEHSLGRLKTMGKAATTRGDYRALKVSFNPHLAPMTRGISVTAYTKAPVSLRQADLSALYREFYKDDPLIGFSEDLPPSKAVYGSDRCLLSVRLDPRTQHIIALATTDNLGKGAAGQAVQNFNVMHGYPETSGLVLEGLWP